MTLTIDRSPDLLQMEVDRHVSRGFYVLSQTDTSAQLIRKKRLNRFWAVFWLIVGLGIGLVIYLCIHMATPAEESVYLLLDAAGKVKRY